MSCTPLCDRQCGLEAASMGRSACAFSKSLADLPKILGGYSKSLASADSLDPHRG
jgi:hypothetical protein